MSEQTKPETKEYVGIVERLLTRYPSLRDLYNKRYPQETLNKDIESAQTTADKPIPPQGP